MNTVLFDLDGTLLPIDEEAFTSVYFRELSRTLQPAGFEHESLIKVVWAGTKCMMKNDGSRRNDEVFWAEFARHFPCDVETVRGLCDAFYENQFEVARTVAKPAPHSAPVVRALRAKGYKPVLATNPVFPMVAVRTRLNWIGLTPEDFDYITSYENSRFCKPSLQYYKGILDAIGAKAEDCLMVGNHALEDMCFEKLGGQVYLVKDHLICADGTDISGYRQGSMADLAAYIDALPRL